MKNQATVT